MVKIRDILEFLKGNGYEVVFTGNEEDSVEGFSSLNQYRKYTMTWCKSNEFWLNTEEKGQNFKLIVLEEGVQPDNRCSNVITAKGSKAVFFGIIEHFFAEETTLSAVGHGTYIGDKVSIGKNVKIGHNCTIDGNIVIGDNSEIHNNVTIINKASIGRNCKILSGCVIGHDDFSYTEDENHNKTMIRHYGGVKIEDDVFVGPNCVINRGTIDDTIIGKGTKIDACCHISHNNVIGEKNAMVSGTRLFGSVKTGENVYIASATVKNQLNIGDNAFLGMGSVVIEDVAGDTTVVGVPAKPIKK